jgi:tetratricopeptide (TPR) repeat protein
LEFKLPQRSRTHQLEDKSINEFKRLLPEQWVCRKKGHDYGVDLEVEIFGEDGQATGCFFNVQLKATDDAEKFDKITIKTDRLHYLASLNVPAIIARYCDPTGAWRWIWNQEALTQVMKPDTQTVTLTLSNDWTQETPFRIENYIIAVRRMHSAGQNENIFIEVENHTGKFQYFSGCERALRRASNALAFIKLTKGRPEDLKLSIQLRDKFIRIELSNVGNLDIGIDDCTYEEISAAILYGLPAVLLKMNLYVHAKSAAMFCLEEYLSTPRKELATEVCRALVSDPLEATNLAILNNLHLEQDYNYSNFVVSLLENGRNDKRYSLALEKLNQEAAKAATAQGRNPSAIFYSLGNSQASMGLYGEAVSSFNRARKLEPSYLSRSYFLSELGGSLFFSRKYRCSVTVYQAALSLEQTEKLQFCVADAQLYAGSFEEASAAFEDLEKTADESLSAEVRLKAQLSRWFFYGHIQAKPYEGEKLHSIMVQAIENGAIIDIHYALLALALLRPQIPESWAAFLQTCFLLSNHKMMLDAMVTAHAECGADAYSICRQKLLETGEIAEATTEIEELDGLFAEARRIDQSRAPTPVTIRLIGENGPEAVFTKK